MATGQPPSHRDLVFKLLVIGDYGVGKTAIVRRYTDGKFSSNYKITIGADFSLKRIIWDEETKVSLQLWDIAGHEKFGYMTRIYYKHAVGCAVVFDRTRMATFQSVGKWVSDIRDKVEDGGELPVVLLANKCDIGETSVTSAQLDKFCHQHALLGWLPTSAKHNLNIDEAFNMLIKEAVARSKEASETQVSKETVSVRERRGPTEQGQCCS